MSTVVLSIFLPKIPPASLISLIANSTPFLNKVPAVVPGPESSTMLAILIVCCACANPANANTAAAATTFNVERLFMCMFLLVKIESEAFIKSARGCKSSNL